jgi:hypothetical protein
MTTLRRETRKVLARSRGNGTQGDQPVGIQDTSDLNTRRSVGKPLHSPVQPLRAHSTLQRLSAYSQRSTATEKRDIAHAA